MYLNTVIGYQMNEISNSGEKSIFNTFYFLALEIRGALKHMALSSDLENLYSSFTLQAAFKLLL